MKSGTSGEKDNSTCPCAATLLTDAADKIFDGGEIHSCEDLADPTEVISDRYACSLYGITTFKPSGYAIEEDFPNEVVLLVRGWSVADFMSDWTKFDAVDD